VSTKARQTRRKTEQAAEKSHAPKPRNAAQLYAQSLLHKYDIVFLIGPAGTGKSHAAVSMTWDRVAKGQCDRVIVTRPMVPCGGEDIGFLPGDKNEKLHPWLMPIEDVLINVVGDRKTAEDVMKSFEALPMAHVRGRNFNSGTVALLDESQNCSVPQLHAYLTRVCEGGKILVCGDPEQGDLYGGGSHLMKVAHALEKQGVAAVVQFTPEMIVRSPIIAGINRAFAEVKADK
jgi:phosphate starvation-inducible protein PhoH and related proteins